MFIRTASEADASAIAALHVASWRVAYRGAFSDDYLNSDIVADRRAAWSERFSQPPKNQFVVVAEMENNIVGFACAYSGQDPKWGTYLDNIHVSTAYQRQAVGTRLMRKVAAWSLATQKHSGLFLWVLQCNHAAQRFYAKLGATEAGADTWPPPGGGSLPRFRYAWPDVGLLLTRCA